MRCISIWVFYGSGATISYCGARAEKKNKEFVPVGIKLRADLAERLENYKAETGANKTFVIEKALEKYLDEVAPVSE